VAASGKYAHKNAAASYTVVFFLAATLACADAIPTAEDINHLAEGVRLTVENFIQQSFKPRLRYEFSDKLFIEEDKENLNKLAKAAGERLEAIGKDQQQLKQQIENYEGDDWNVRYGSTDLWRKLSRDVYTTFLAKCEVDFYLAVSAQQPQRNKLLHKILDQIDSLDQISNTAYAQFLKAKALALLARTDPSFKPQAKEKFDLLRERYGMLHSTALKISIERIKLLGPGGPDELANLAEAIAQSSYANDIELTLSLAFLQRRYNPDALEQTARKWPQLEDFLSSLILSELSHDMRQGQLELQKISAFEAELAAQAAWKDDAQRHKPLLDCLANTQEFQTPLTLYVTAIASADSSPAKAVNLLVKASKAQQTRGSDRLETSASEIAEQAARLAYNLFAQDKGNCQPAVEAFGNYCTIAGEKIDEELEYLHSVVLNSCRLTEKGTELLEKIAGRPAGKWRNRARLDLILQAIEQKQHENQKRRTELLKQLNDLIADCTRQKEGRLRTEAIAVYCPLLLESKDNDSAVNVLNILAETDANCNPNLYVFKSKALQQLCRLDESADCLLRAIDPDSCQRVADAMQLLAEVVDEIDRFGTEGRDSMENCRRLAQFCYDCLDGTPKQKAALFLIETSAFGATDASEKLSPFEKLLDTIAKQGLSDDVDFLRCSARVSLAQGKFAEAAGFWAKVAAIRKGETQPANQRSWKWWRARYYELYCRSKWPKTDMNSLLHTIEVLESSYPRIPPLWAEKLASLRQQCQSQLISAGN
jgi:hypothetical protein